MDTLRTSGGLSGFTNRAESEYDCFGAGHSSTSVSAGLGFAIADKLQGNNSYTVVVLGDGAFTGGMVHEALNNINKDLKLIIVLNDNEMSISKNRGSFAKILTKLRLHPTYVNAKGFVRKLLKAIPIIGDPLFGLLKYFKKRLKDAFYGSNYFENLGLFYVGPVDGNNEKQVEDALRIAKSYGESSIVHVKTVKGKGYAPAEENPAKYHGISPKSAKPQETNFSNELGKIMVELAKNDENVCAITAAMLDGTGLCEFAKQYPNRTFDVGIAEEHALTFACGLAAEKMKPYFAVYSTFLQRSYDNLLHDMALQNLPVRLCIDRAGLNSADGATHHGIYDVAMLSQIPNFTLYSPISYSTLRIALHKMNEENIPCGVRYHKGEENQDIIDEFYKEPPQDLSIKANFTDPEKLDALIITHGAITAEAIKATKILANEGVNAGIILCERILPYNSLVQDLIAKIPQKSLRIVFLEEEIKAGGFGMMLSEKLSHYDIMKNKSVEIIALEETMADKYGSDIYASFGLDAQSISQRIMKM